MGRILKALILIFFIAACSEHDLISISKDKIFTLLVDHNLPTAYSANWLIIHDTKGNLLFSQLFESGDTIIFETVDKIDGDKINITLLDYSLIHGSAGGKVYDLTSFLQISTGEEWAIKEAISGPYIYGTQVGKFNVTVTDLPIDTRISLTDELGNEGSFVWDNSNANTYSGEAPISTNSSDYLLYVRDNQDRIRYKFFDNVVIDSNYSTSFLNMSNPDDLTEIILPANDGIVLTVDAWEENQPNSNLGFRLNDFYDFDSPRTKINIGFMDRLLYYRTHIAVYVSGRIYQYDKDGAKPLSINLASDALFTQTNGSVSNFSFTASSGFERRETLWYYYQEVNGYSTKIQWVVNSPEEGDQRIGPLPDDFQNKYPELTFDKFYKAANSTFYLRGSTYKDLIDTRFKGKEQTSGQEIYSVKLE